MCFLRGAALSCKPRCEVPDAEIQIVHIFSTAILSFSRLFSCSHSLWSQASELLWWKTTVFIQRAAFSETSSMPPHINCPKFTQRLWLLGVILTGAYSEWFHTFWLIKLPSSAECSTIIHSEFPHRNFIPSSVKRIKMTLRCKDMAR